MRSILLKTSALGLVMALAACQHSSDFDARYEGVTEYAGNSQAVNRAKHVDDFWKPNSDNTNIPGDGQRLGNAVNKLREPKDEDDVQEAKTTG